jgi:hypothetical protein
MERRRCAVSTWLEELVRDERSECTPSPDEEQNVKAVLDLLRQHRVQEASDLAASSGFLR